MHNFEDIIEKYRKELMEFSKHSPVHTASENAEYREAAEVMTDAVQPNTTQTVTEAARAAITAGEPYDNYDDFIENNRSEGLLRVQVFAADGSFPIANASVKVSVKLRNEERDIFNAVTDVDGIVDNIRLPAPDSSVSFDENSTVEPYAVYTLTVSHPQYASAKFEGIPVFDSVKSIQPVELVPLGRDGSEPEETVVPSEPMELYGGES